MPTRIRSNGMSIALVINQLVSTTLAVVFLPVASKYGYSAMFFLFAGFTVIYFITAAFFLPETKGKTLEEIEARFAEDRRHRKISGLFNCLRRALLTRVPHVSKRHEKSPVTLPPTAAAGCDKCPSASPHSENSDRPR